MNIIDAVKSGKRIKQKSCDTWYQPEHHCYSAGQILATDWEIEDRKIEITEGTFWSAYAEALKAVEIDNRRTQYSPEVSVVIDEFKKRLFGKTPGD